MRNMEKVWGDVMMIMMKHNTKVVDYIGVVSNPTNMRNSGTVELSAS